MFNKQEETRQPKSYKGYIRNLRTLLVMKGTQALCVPSGHNGLYHQFSIILEGRDQSEQKEAALGRIIEGTFSLQESQQFLERFHQSFFFYLLPSGGRYVSIGLYVVL